jgi:LuxR family transcriptional regulator, maltose regulon positive regulatory protein
VELLSHQHTPMFLIESSNDLRATRTELIVEKIVKPSFVPQLSRERLLAILENSLISCTATIISGRAGTGKTALALDFAQHCERSVVWYKVDAPDGGIQIFFQYLIASIRRQRPGFGAATLAQLARTSSPEQIPLLAETLVYELSEGETKPLLVVIEDLHLVYDFEWVAPFFRRLLPLLPSEVHMLITTRTMPAAPFWRMRSKQTLSVIDEEALGFTRQEAVELFKSYQLSAEQASIALDHARGRAAALARFAALLTDSTEERYPERVAVNARVG